MSCMIHLVSSTILILTFLQPLTAQTNPDQPNVLVIIADDLGLDPLQGYLEGGIKANTPNLNSLASRGITFTNAWITPLARPISVVVIALLLQMLTKNQ